MTIAVVGSAWGGGFNLGGSIFAIEGEYLFIADIRLPIAVGDTFNNLWIQPVADTPISMLVVAMLVWFVPGASELIEDLAMAIVVAVVY